MADVPPPEGIVLAHFIVFEIDPETGKKIKKICRYQQFRAVNKAVQRVARERHSCRWPGSFRAKSRPYCVPFCF